MTLYLTLALAGYSIVGALVLLCAYLFFLPHMRKTLPGKIACAALLATLVALQFFHIEHALHATALMESRLYGCLVLLAPVAFYFFSRDLLLPEPAYSPRQLLHLLPLLLVPFAPVGVIVPVAFTIGAGYSIWFANLVFGMRRHVRRFRFELFFFGFFAVVALAVLLLGLGIPYVEATTFHLVYANLIGLAFVLITAALIVFPEITSDIAEASQLSYATSTLKEIDVAERLRRLDELMSGEKLFRNENLNLSMLAESLGLSGHQTSELINTQFEIGFSRYVRELRVADAQQMLREDRDASVLSISLAAGFGSQSSFYAAFREITGEAPGTWRKKLQTH